MATLVLIIAANVMDGIGFFNPTTETILYARQSSIVQGVRVCVTAATSIIATCILGARIYSSTSLNRQARRRYTHIIEIMMQSSLLYSLSMLALAIATLTDNGNLFSIRSIDLNAQVYTNALSVITTVWYSLALIFRAISDYLDNRLRHSHQP